MAIDSEDKRRQIGGVPPIPDGTIDEADRRRIAGIYAFEEFVPLPIVTQSPVLGTPVIEEINALSPNNIVAQSPVLGIPAVEGAELSPLIIVSQNPVLGTPDIGQEHDLTAANIASQSPVLGTPLLESYSGDDVCVADNILSGTPVLGTPTIGQVHVFTASNIASQNSVLGTPILVGSGDPYIVIPSIPTYNDEDSIVVRSKMKSLIVLDSMINRD